MITAETFQELTGVSSKTLETFQTYKKLLLKWQKNLNLVGQSTVSDIWGRHFLDCAQIKIFSHQILGGKKQISWIDFGTGAGFPGLVLSLLGGYEIFLIEKNKKKCAFLRSVIRETGASAKVITDKIENVQPFPVDCVTTRALAPLSQILVWGNYFLHKEGQHWLLKGKNVDLEISDAQNFWDFEYKIFPSLTNPSGQILFVYNVARKSPSKTTQNKMLLQ